MISNKQVREWVHQSSFIFAGKVINTDPPADTVPVETKYATVEVSAVISAPPVFAGFRHQQVTGLFGDRQSPAKGKRMIFFTRPRVYGDSLQTEVIGYEEDEGGFEKTIDNIEKAKIDMENEAIRNRFGLAVAVIEGTVAHVRHYPGTPSRISEHDPDWHVATVEINEVIKGTLKTKQVEVLFAKSRDVRWFKSPKLEDGMHRVFLLHLKEELRNEGPGHHSKNNMSQSIPEGGFFVVVDPLDVLPVTELERVRSLKHK